MTPICLKSIEPYPFLVQTNQMPNYMPFLEFLRRVTPLLAPKFCPPRTIHAQFSRAFVDEDVLQIGDLQAGFEIAHTLTIHPHWSYVAGETLQIKAYGLPADYYLSLIVSQVMDGPAPGNSLSLWGNGPKPVLEIIADSFTVEFGAQSNS